MPRALILVLMTILLAAALLFACAPGAPAIEPLLTSSQASPRPSSTPTPTLTPTLTATPSPRPTATPTPTATVAIELLELISPANASRLSLAQSFVGLQSASGKSLAALQGSRYALVMTDNALLVWDLRRRAIVRQVDAGASSFDHAWAYDEVNDRLWWSFNNQLFNGPAASPLIDLSAQAQYETFFTGGCCELIDISPAGRLLVWFQHLALRIINLEKHSSAVIYPPLSMQLQGFSPDGSLLYTITDTGWLALYNTSGGWLRSFPLRRDDRISFSADGAVVIALSAENQLRLLEVKTGALLRTVELQASGSGDSGFVFAPTLDLAAAIRTTDGVKNTILLWDLNTGVMVTALPAGCDNCNLDALAFSPDGRLLLASLDNGKVQVWGVTPGRESGSQSSD